MRQGRRRGTRSCSARSQTTGTCAARCPWRLARGSDTRPGAGGAIRGRELGSPAADPSVGHERGDMVSVYTGDLQSRPGVMRSFRGITRIQVGQPWQVGQFGDPRAAADLVVDVARLGRHPGRDEFKQFGDLRKHTACYQMELPPGGEPARHGMGGPCTSRPAASPIRTATNAA